jgi:hypothetical protein
MEGFQHVHLCSPINHPEPFDHAQAKLQGLSPAVEGGGRIPLLRCRPSTDFIPPVLAGPGSEAEGLGASAPRSALDDTRERVFHSSDRD